MASDSTEDDAGASSPSDNKAPANNSSSLWTWFQNFADEQNVGRLKDCEQLSHILKACQAKQYDEIPPLDHIGLGKKWMYFFGWRDLPVANRKGCIPEKHALWACRASAVRCGNDVRLLKQCFENEGMEAILGQPKTAYESGKKDIVRELIPCYDLQRVIGKCVAKNSKELEQRRNGTGS